jgi:hypothetical protein
MHGSRLNHQDTLISSPDSHPEPRVLMPIPKVAERAQISVWSVRAEIKRGNLVAKRIGRLLRVTPADFDAWIAELPTTGRGI